MNIRNLLSLAAFLLIAASCGRTEATMETTVENKHLKTLNTTNVCPSSIASDKRGNLYVADKENGTIEMISLSGDRILYAENLGSPSSIAVDNSGNIYVLNNENNSLLVVNKNKKISVAAENIGESIGLTVDYYGRVSVLCRDNVKIFNLGY